MAELSVSEPGEGRYRYEALELMEIFLGEGAAAGLW